MNRWLAAATVVVLALLALLWLQIREPAAAVTAAPQREVAEAPATPAAIHGASDLAIAAQKARELQAQSGKVDPASDGFTYHYDEVLPPMLTMSAAKCYEGGLNRVHRNQKTKLGFKVQIKNGTVTIHDVKVTESTINDQALNDCFVREVAKVTWQDDALPDWTQDDNLLIRPERGMKKFTKENLEYEGDGPIGKLEDPGHVHTSREQPEDQRGQ